MMDPLDPFLTEPPQGPRGKLPPGVQLGPPPGAEPPTTGFDAFHNAFQQQFGRRLTITGSSQNNPQHKGRKINAFDVRNRDLTPEENSWLDANAPTYRLKVLTAKGGESWARGPHKHFEPMDVDEEGALLQPSVPPAPTQAPSGGARLPEGVFLGPPPTAGAPASEGPEAAPEQVPEPGQVFLGEPPPAAPVRQVAPRAPRIAPQVQMRRRIDLEQDFKAARETGDKNRMAVIGAQLKPLGYEVGEGTGGWTYIKPPAPRNRAEKLWAQADKIDQEVADRYQQVQKTRELINRWSAQPPPEGAPEDFDFRPVLGAVSPADAAAQHKNLDALNENLQLARQQAERLRREAMGASTAPPSPLEEVAVRKHALYEGSQPLTAPTIPAGATGAEDLEAFKREIAQQKAVIAIGKRTAEQLTRPVPQRRFWEVGGIDDPNLTRDAYRQALTNLQDKVDASEALLARVTKERQTGQPQPMTMAEMKPYMQQVATWAAEAKSLKPQKPVFGPLGQALGAVAQYASFGPLFADAGKRANALNAAGKATLITQAVAYLTDIPDRALRTVSNMLLADSARAVAAIGSIAGMPDTFVKTMLQSGENLEALTKIATPNVDEQAVDTLRATIVPAVASTIAMMMPGSAVAKLAGPLGVRLGLRPVFINRLSTMLTSGFHGGGRGFAEAIKEGATPEEARFMWGVEALGGMSEAAGIPEMFVKLQQGRYFKRFLGHLIGQLPEETGQEIGQTLLSQAGKKLSYKPEQQLGEGLNEAAIGAMAATLIFAGGAAIAKAPSTTPAAPSGQPPLPPVAGAYGAGAPGAGFIVSGEQPAVAVPPSAPAQPDIDASERQIFGRPLHPAERQVVMSLPPGTPPLSLDELHAYMRGQGMMPAPARGFEVELPEVGGVPQGEFPATQPQRVQRLSDIEQDRLREMGFSEDEIARTTPQRAMEIAEGEGELAALGARERFRQEQATRAATERGFEVTEGAPAVAPERPEHIRFQPSAEPVPVTPQPRYVYVKSRDAKTGREIVKRYRFDQAAGEGGMRVVDPVTGAGRLLNVSSPAIVKPNKQQGQIKYVTHGGAFGAPVEVLRPIKGGFEVRAEDGSLQRYAAEFLTDERPEFRRSAVSYGGEAGRARAEAALNRLQAERPEIVPGGVELIGGGYRYLWRDPNEMTAPARPTPAAARPRATAAPAPAVPVPSEQILLKEPQGPERRVSAAGYRLPGESQADYKARLTAQGYTERALEIPERPLPEGWEEPTEYAGRGEPTTAEERAAERPGEELPRTEMVVPEAEITESLKRKLEQQREPYTGPERRIQDVVPPLERRAAAPAPAAPVRRQEPSPLQPVRNAIDTALDEANRFIQSGGTKGRSAQSILDSIARLRQGFAEKPEWKERANEIRRAEETLRQFAGTTEAPAAQPEKAEAAAPVAPGAPAPAARTAEAQAVIDEIKGGPAKGKYLPEHIPVLSKRLSDAGVSLQDQVAIFNDIGFDIRTADHLFATVRAMEAALSGEKPVTIKHRGRGKPGAENYISKGDLIMIGRIPADLKILVLDPQTGRSHWIQDPTTPVGNKAVRKFNEKDVKDLPDVTAEMGVLPGRYPSDKAVQGVAQWYGQNWTTIEDVPVNIIKELAKEGIWTGYYENLKELGLVGDEEIPGNILLKRIAQNIELGGRADDSPLIMKWRKDTASTSTTNVFVDITKSPKVFAVAAHDIFKLGKSIVEATEELVTKFGESVRPFVSKIWASFNGNNPNLSKSQKGTPLGELLDRLAVSVRDDQHEIAVFYIRDKGLKTVSAFAKQMRSLYGPEVTDGRIRNIWNEVQQYVDPKTLKPREIKQATSALNTLRSRGEEAWAGVPQDIKKPEDLALKRREWELNARIGTNSRFWYERSSQAILDMFGGDKDNAGKFVQLLAIYSSKTDVQENFIHALRVWNQFLNEGKIAGGAMGWMDRQGSKLLYNGVEWEGRKRNNFYLNLMTIIDPNALPSDAAAMAGVTEGPDRAVTVDIHMLRAFGYTQDRKGNINPTPARHDFVTREVQRIADKIGWKPPQVQASMWTTQRARDVLKTERAKSANKSIESNPPATVISSLTQNDIDFKSAMENILGQIQFESAPGATTGRLPGYAAATPEQKQEYHEAILKVVQPSIDELFAELGIPRAKIILAPGVYNGVVSPGFQLQLPVVYAQKTKGGKPIPGALGRVDRAQRPWLDALTSYIGAITGQDAAAWVKPFYSKDIKQGDMDTVELSLGRLLTLDEATELDAALEQHLGRGYAFTQGTETGTYIRRGGSSLNEKQQTELDRLEIRPNLTPKQSATLKNLQAIRTRDNLDFNKKVEVAVESVWNENDGRPDSIELWKMRADGNLIENDWQGGTNVESYKERYSATGSPSVFQRYYDRTRPQVDAIDADFARRYGWDKPATIGPVTQARTFGPEAKAEGEQGLAAATEKFRRAQEAHRRGWIDDDEFYVAEQIYEEAKAEEVVGPVTQVVRGRYGVPPGMVRRGDLKNPDVDINFRKHRPGQARRAYVNDAAGVAIGTMMGISSATGFSLNQQQMRALSKMLLVFSNKLGLSAYHPFRALGEDLAEALKNGEVAYDVFSPDPYSETLRDIIVTIRHETAHSQTEILRRSLDQTTEPKQTEQFVDELFGRGLDRRELSAGQRAARRLSSILEAKGYDFDPLFHAMEVIGHAAGGELHLADPAAPGPQYRLTPDEQTDVIKHTVMSLFRAYGPKAEAVFERAVKMTRDINRSIHDEARQARQRLQEGGGAGGLGGAVSGEGEGYPVPGPGPRRRPPGPGFRSQAEIRRELQEAIRSGPTGRRKRRRGRAAAAEGGAGEQLELPLEHRLGPVSEEIRPEVRTLRKAEQLAREAQEILDNAPPDAAEEDLEEMRDDLQVLQWGVQSARQHVEFMANWRQKFEDRVARLASDEQEMLNDAIGEMADALARYQEKPYSPAEGRRVVRDAVAGSDPIDMLRRLANISVPEGGPSGTAYERGLIIKFGKLAPEVEAALDYLQDAIQPLLTQQPILLKELSNILQSKKFQAGPTNTPAFKKWFKKSAVVDENGEPRVQYHGTDQDFVSFLTAIPYGEIAAHFGTQSQANDLKKEREGSRVMPVYLSIQNPLRLRDVGSFEDQDVIPQLVELGLMTAEEDRRMNDRNVVSYHDRPQAVQDFIASKGYDGIVYLNRHEGGIGGLSSLDTDARSRYTDAQFKERYPHAEDSYAAFYPEQVKSALGNIGTFDPNEPSILQSKPFPKDQTKTPAFKKWFKKSMVVDEAGQPMRVFRGEYGPVTDNPFESTKLDVRATPTFVLRPDIADMYAISPNDARDTATNPRVGAYYLSIQNPLTLSEEHDPFTEIRHLEPLRESMGNGAFEKLLDKFYWRYEGEDVDRVDLNPEQRLGAYTDSYRVADSHAVTDAAKAAGYDGFDYYASSQAEEAHELRPFNPEQIKSALGNRGTFSLEESNILLSKEFPKEEEVEAKWEPRPDFFGQEYGGRNPQVDTPEFKEFFEGSKVIDVDGSPLTVFHGTLGDFDVFDTKGRRSANRAGLGELGTWFTGEALHQGNYDVGNAEFVASDFTRNPYYLDMRQVDTLGYVQWEQNGQSVYNIQGGKNGKRLINKIGIPKEDLASVVGKETADRIIAGEKTSIVEERGFAGEEPTKWNVLSGDLRVEDTDEFRPGGNVMPAYLSIKNPYEVEEYEQLLDERGNRSVSAYKDSLIKKGYDGIVVRNSMTDGDVDRDDWVAFYPNQIKSATGNRGTFDPNLSDITQAKVLPREARFLRKRLEDKAAAMTPEEAEALERSETLTLDRWLDERAAEGDKRPLARLKQEYVDQYGKLVPHKIGRTEMMIGESLLEEPEVVPINRQKIREEVIRAGGTAELADQMEAAMREGAVKKPKPPKLPSGLAADRFYDHELQRFSKTPEGEERLIPIRRLGYETATAIHDVEVMPDGSRFYRTNGKIVEPNRLHRAIIDQYDLPPVGEPVPTHQLPSEARKPREVLRVEEPEGFGPITQMRVAEGRAAAGGGGRLMSVMALNLYPGNVAKVNVKEGIQNAVDGVRAMPEGHKGKITVNVDTVNRSIEIIDNGIGMSPKVAGDEFLDPGETFKPGPKSSGGYGIAKVALIGNAEEIDVVTRWRNPKVGDKQHDPNYAPGSVIETTVSGGKDVTPAYEEWTDKTIGLRIASKEVASSTPTGTSLILHVREPNTGEESRLEFDEEVLSDQMATFMRNSMLPYEFDFNVDSEPVTQEKHIQPFSHFGEGLEHEVHLISSIDIPGAKIDIHASNETTERNSTNVQVLNNGLPQFTRYFKVSPGDEAVLTPQRVVIDVHATGNPEDANYPFAPNRENLQSEATQAIERFMKRLGSEAASRERDLYISTLKNSPRILNAPRPEPLDQQAYSRRFVGDVIHRIVDSSGQMPPEFMTELSRAPYAAKLSKGISKAMDVLASRLSRGDAQYTEVHYAGLATGTTEGTTRWFGINIPHSMVYGEPGPDIVLMNPYAAAEMIDRQVQYNIIGEEDATIQLARSLAATLLHELTHRPERGHGVPFSGQLTRNIAETAGPAFNEATQAIYKALGKDYIGKGYQKSIFQEVLAHAQRITEISESNPEGEGVFSKIGSHATTGREAGGVPVDLERRGEEGPGREVLVRRGEGVSPAGVAERPGAEDLTEFKAWYKQFMGVDLDKPIGQVGGKPAPPPTPDQIRQLRDRLPEGLSGVQSGYLTEGKKASQMIGVFDKAGQLIGTASLSLTADPAKWVKENYGAGYMHGPLTMELDQIPGRVANKVNLEPEPDDPQWIKDTRERVRKALTGETLSANPINVFADVGILTGHSIYKAAKNFTSWASQMLKRLGDAIRPRLLSIYRQVRVAAKEFHENEAGFLRISLPTRQPPRPRMVGGVLTPRAEHSSGWEIAKLVRKAWMLASPKTDVRNFGGTGIFQGLEEVARIPGSMLDATAGAVSMQRGFTGPDLRAFARAGHEAATRGAREAWEIVRNGVPQNNPAQILEELDTGYPALDHSVNFIFRKMSAEDRIMNVFATHRSLEGRAKAIALTERKRGTLTISVADRTAQIVASPSPTLWMEALADGLMATFNNPNVVAEAIAAARARLRAHSTAGRITDFAIDMVMPFDRTPTNIITRLFEYSPAGAVYGLGQVGVRTIASRVAGTAFTPQDQLHYSRTFGRGVTGTGLIYLGYLLYLAGAAMPMYDDDLKEAKKNRANKEAGRSPMSVRIGNKWRTIGAFSPMGNLIAIGATMAANDQESGSVMSPLLSIAASYYKQPRTWMKAAQEQPLLEAAGDITKAIQSDKKLENFAGRLAGSMIPGGGLMRDIATALDTKARKQSGFVGQAIGGVPGLRQLLPEDVGVQHSRWWAIDPFRTTTDTGAPDVEMRDRLGRQIIEAFKKQDFDQASKWIEEGVKSGIIAEQDRSFNIWEDKAFLTELQYKVKHSMDVEEALDQFVSGTEKERQEIIVQVVDKIANYDKATDPSKPQTIPKARQEEIEKKIERAEKLNIEKYLKAAPPPVLPPQTTAPPPPAP